MSEDPAACPGIKRFHHFKLIFNAGAVKSSLCALKPVSASKSIPPLQLQTPVFSWDKAIREVPVLLVRQKTPFGEVLTLIQLPPSRAVVLYSWSQPVNFPSPITSCNSKAELQKLYDFHHNIYGAWRVFLLFLGELLFLTKTDIFHEERKLTKTASTI